MKRVLLVEDSLAQRKYLEALLRQELHCEVISASDGKEAILLLKEISVDAVVCDIEMPQVDGRGVLEYLQRKSRKVPVIMVTAKSLSSKLKEDLIHLGATDAVSKERFEADITTLFTTHGGL